MSKRKLLYLAAPGDTYLGPLHGFAEHLDVSVLNADGFGDLNRAGVDYWRGPGASVREFDAILVAHERAHTTPDWLLSASVPRLFLSIDPIFFPDEHRLLAPCCDAVLSASRDFVDVYHRLGLQRAEWFPYAYSPAEYFPAPAEKKWDLLFVGNVIPSIHDRRSRLLNLLSTEFSVRITRLPRDEVSAAYQEARIVLNIGATDRMNLRVFEALGAGAFLLTSWADDLTPHFEDGVDLVTFTDDTVVDLARRYLSDDVARERVAAHGHRTASQGHTWAHRGRRLAELIDELIEAGVGAPAKPPAARALRSYRNRELRGRSLVAAFERLPTPIQSAVRKVRGFARRSES